MADPGDTPPPGTGPVRLRVRVPSGRIFAVVAATLSEYLDATWQIRGTLGTDTGDVRAREGERQGELGLLLEDRLNRYGYVYRTQQLMVLRRVMRVRLDWSYTPGSLVPTALEVWRREGLAPFKVSTIQPVAATTQAYRYFDTAIEAGHTYEWFVVAIDAEGRSSEPSSIATATIPHALATPGDLTATFVAES